VEVDLGEQLWRTVELLSPLSQNVSSYVGDLAGVNNNAAYNSFRLYELWVEKGFKVGPFVGLLKAGLLSADQEFDLIDAASFFINSSFAADLAFGGSVPIPIYPSNALAARLKLSAGPFSSQPFGQSQLAVFLRCSLGPYDSDKGARSRLEKQPTDFRQNICYFGDRTLVPGSNLYLRRAVEDEELD
jgi:hypothetical protein